MKASQPMYINARLSVVCAWSNPVPKQAPTPTKSGPVIAREDFEKQLSEQSSDLKQNYSPSQTDTP